MVLFRLGSHSAEPHVPIAGCFATSASHVDLMENISQWDHNLSNFFHNGLGEPLFLKRVLQMLLHHVKMVENQALFKDSLMTMQQGFGGLICFCAGRQ